MEFYQKLQHNARRLKEKAAGLCKVQREEREMVEAKLKPKGTTRAIFVSEIDRDSIEIV